MINVVSYGGSKVNWYNFVTFFVNDSYNIYAIYISFVYKHCHKHLPQRT